MWQLTQFTWQMRLTHRQAAVDTQTKPTTLGCDSACKAVPPPSPFSIVTQTKSYNIETVQVTPLSQTLASSPQCECASCHQQTRVGSKSLLQQNPPVLNWQSRHGWSDRLGWVCWLMLNNRRQSIGPKPDSRPRLEGVRYKYLTSCSCLLSPPSPFSHAHIRTHH